MCSTCSRRGVVGIFDAQAGGHETGEAWWPGRPSGADRACCKAPPAQPPWSASVRALAGGAAAGHLSPVDGEDFVGSTVEFHQLVGDFIVILQVVNEAQRLNVGLRQKVKCLAEQKGIAGQQGMDHLRPREEVIREIGTVSDEWLELPQGHIQLVKAPTAEASGEKRQVIRAPYGKRMLVMPGHETARTRFDSQEGHRVEPNAGGAEAVNRAWSDRPPRPVPQRSRDRAS